MEGKIMETKRQLRKDIEALRKEVDCLQGIICKEIGELKLQICELQADADWITGKEAAKMLGYTSEWVSSTTLNKKGIANTKDSNGCLKVSRACLEEYLNHRKTTDED